MSQNKSSSNQIIPLSSGQKSHWDNYENNKIEVSEAILRKVIVDYTEKSEQRQRKIIAEVVNQEVSSKIIRLENSINRLVNQFEEIKNGDAEDAVLRVTTDSNASDLASVSVTISEENMYPYFCQNLADKLEVRKYDVVQMIKIFELRKHTEHHREFSTSKNNKVSKWSEATYRRLKQALDLGEYPRPTFD